MTQWIACCFTIALRDVSAWPVHSQSASASGRVNAVSRTARAAANRSGDTPY